MVDDLAAGLLDVVWAGLETIADVFLEFALDFVEWIIPDGDGRRGRQGRAFVSEATRSPSFNTVALTLGDVPACVTHASLEGSC